MQSRTTRRQPGAAARRGSVVVAVVAAASLGALGAASAQGLGSPVPAGTSSVPAAAPVTTGGGTTGGGTTGVGASVTTAPDVTTAPASVLDRDDVLAILNRADDYLAAHPDAVGGPVAQAASETGMLLVTYDAQVAATAALTPPVDLPVSALEPPDPLTTSPWDKAVAKTSGDTDAADDAAPTADPAAPASTESTAPTSTASPSSTSSPTLPSDGATTGVLAADGAAPTGLLPPTGTTPTGSATDAPAAADTPQANPTSPAGAVDDGATGALIPDPATTAVQGSMPSVDEPTSPAVAVPGATPTPTPTASVPSSAPTSVPTAEPTSPAGTVPAPSDDVTTAPGATPTTSADGSVPTANAPTDEGTPSTTPTPSATPTPSTTAPAALPTPSATATPDTGTDSSGVDGSSSVGTGASAAGGIPSTTTDSLADPDAQDGSEPVTWDDVVAAAERLATALDAATAAQSAAGTTGTGVVGGDGVAATTAPLTGGLANQLTQLVDRYGTSIDGYKNGEIPASALCPLDFAPGQMLRCDAANRLEALSKLFEKRFGHPIPITDSYRPLAVQIELRRTKPNLAAVPGTSNHGWGLAVDLGYPISTGRSAEYAWLREHGPAYGWDNPAWGHLDGSKPEPWHFEFHTGGLLPTGTPVIDYTGVTVPSDTEAGPKAPSDHATAPKTSKPGAATVVVPKGLVGHSFATVQKKLEGLGLKVAKPTKAYSATVKAGAVVRVTPGSGSKVKAGSTVRAVVSQGPKPATTVTIPDGLVGQPLATVQKKLTGLGVKVVVDPKKVYSDAVKVGSVASVSPAEGTSVKVGSTVTLVVSQGSKPPATVTISDGLVGQPLATVQKKLTGLGVKVVVDPKKVYSDAVKAGSVASVSPAEGTSVKVGSTVTLVVSQGPKPPATVTIPEGFVGQDPDTIKDKLVALGLKVVIADVEETSDAPAGTVAGLTKDDGTELAEGSQVEAGSTVTIVVSSGQDGSVPTPTPTGTPTTEPTGSTSEPTATPTEKARESETD
ncbi:PASTA domain-containing protein [Luteimicrobium xylanilyticum]|nr:PASTA domain-containing protein [Luteimicrobium xylanilyticum]